jgi:hypothetical protein
MPLEGLPSTAGNQPAHHLQTGLCAHRPYQHDTAPRQTSCWRVPTFMDQTFSSPERMAGKSAAQSA